MEELTLYLKNPAVFFSFLNGLVFVGFSLLFYIPTLGRLVAGLQRDLLCTK